MPFDIVDADRLPADGDYPWKSTPSAARVKRLLECTCDSNRKALSWLDQACLSLPNEARLSMPRACRVDLTRLPLGSAPLGDPAGVTHLKSAPGWVVVAVILRMTTHRSRAMRIATAYIATDAQRLLPANLAAHMLLL